MAIPQDAATALEMAAKITAGYAASANRDRKIEDVLREMFYTIRDLQGKSLKEQP
jgi:hypothetical protein